MKFTIRSVCSCPGTRHAVFQHNCLNVWILVFLTAFVLLIATQVLSSMVIAGQRLHAMRVGNPECSEPCNS